jgi:hypothetical protein
MREPYLSRVLSGEKTIESRFLRIRTAPYGRVAAADRLLLKRAGGPIVASARVARVAEFDGLTPQCVADLIARYAAGLCLDDGFGSQVQYCRYAVLLWLSDIAILTEPPPLTKRDRRAWVVL